MEATIMVYRGHVENGVIQLEDAPTLPEGVEVEVRLLADDASREKAPRIPSVCEALKDFVGKAEGLPPDLAENHGYYLHGRARQ